LKNRVIWQPILMKFGLLAHLKLPDLYKDFLKSNKVDGRHIENRKLALFMP